MTRPARSLILLVLFAVLPGCDVPDDMPASSGKSVDKISKIVTLSPHLAELVFAVGAGDLLVGVSAYTDYPQAAASLPVIGDAFNVDQERLTMLDPDLLLTWDTGTPMHVIDELRSRGYRVEVVSTRSLREISAALRQIGVLTAHEASANEVAKEFEIKIAQFAKESVNSNSIKVFYQIAARPLYTVNGNHYVSQLIELCGGENIFADLSGLAPLISVEAVLQRDPEVILAGSDAGPEAFVEWRRWSDLAAIRYDNQFLMPANEISRATPRLLVAAEAVCDALRQSRDNRQALGH